MGELCESTDRITRRMVSRMSRAEAERALRNLTEIQKDLEAQMGILQERIDEETEVCPICEGSGVTQEDGIKYDPVMCNECKGTGKVPRRRNPP